MEESKMSLNKSTKLEEANKFELEVAVDKETFAAATTKVYKKQVKNINIPGFRKGKAPKHIIERMYGKGVFYDDAIEETYPTALSALTTSKSTRFQTTVTHSQLLLSLLPSSQLRATRASRLRSSQPRLQTSS